MPEEERVKYSAMTGQSLFYMGETNLKHKILAIAEEEGASQASYALEAAAVRRRADDRQTGKDAATRQPGDAGYRVEGPVMMLLTTTAIDIDEELLNRCLVLTVDEGREQTRRSTAAAQKRTLDGLLAGDRAEGRLRACTSNAQRLLRPLAVVNPYADQLTFLTTKTRTRRDHDEVPDADRHHRAAAPASAASQDASSMRGQTLRVHRGDAGRHRAGQPARARGAGPQLDELPPQTRRLLAASSSAGCASSRAQRRRCQRATCASRAATCARRPAGATRS